MSNLESEFRLLLQIESVDDLDAEEALNHLARLIDLASDFKHVEGTIRALQVGEAIGKRTLSSAQTAILNYYLSNAWANRRHLERTTALDEWKWEQPEIETQIIHLRRALRNDGFSELHPLRQCQIVTNIGNLFNAVGRFVEAIEYWDEALAVIPSFGMAQGNRGYGLTCYARVLYDEGQRPVFLRYAYVGLRAALSSNPDDVCGVNPLARDGFGEQIAWLESTLVPEYLSLGTQMEEFPLGECEDEIKYRQWCLRNRLFLNPLNDLGPCSIAAHDSVDHSLDCGEAGRGNALSGILQPTEAGVRFGPLPLLRGRDFDQAALLGQGRVALQHPGLPGLLVRRREGEGGVQDGILPAGQGVVLPQPLPRPENP